MRRIVVGVDTSPDAIRALEWAVAVAEPLDAEVRAVHAYAPPTVYFPYSTVTADEMHEALEEQTREAAQTVLDETLSRVKVPEGVHVEPVLARERAVDALLHEAEQADLLVVGSRGHGGFSGLLLGSVSQQAVHHAPCPVVVVPPSDGR